MKKSFLVLSFATVGLTVAAQKIINDPNVQKRNVSGYHAISVSGGIDIYLSQGNESVAVSASEVKYRDRIQTEVKDGVLSIWYEYNSNLHIDGNNRKLKAYISFDDLDKITASGGSDVNVDGSIKVTKLNMHFSGGSDFNGKVDVGDLKVEASGGSDTKISGTAKNVSVDASGGSDFKGYDLASDYCDLSASGGSDVYITVNKELSAHASGGSDVYYKGDGTIRQVKSNGSGSIKKVTR